MDYQGGVGADVGVTEQQLAVSFDAAVADAEAAYDKAA
jgi:hypothetical protein